MVVVVAVICFGWLYVWRRRKRRGCDCVQEYGVSGTWVLSGDGNGDGPLTSVKNEAGQEWN